MPKGGRLSWMHFTRRQNSFRRRWRLHWRRWSRRGRRSDGNTLRCQQPVTLQTMQGTVYLTKSGHVRMCPASDSLITPFAEIQDCFYAVCGYSVHSVQHALTNGYVPLAGGHRAGICGTAVLNSEGEIINVRRITSLNIRVAREVRRTCPERGGRPSA